MERSLDECWPRRQDNTPYERIGSLEVGDFVRKVELKLGIHFTTLEHHRLEELFKYKPKVGVARRDILELLTRIGNTMNAHMKSDDTDEHLSLHLPKHTLGLVERTATFLLGRNRAKAPPPAISEEEPVISRLPQRSQEEMQIERLRSHVESLEKLILLESVDSNVSDLLKLAYNNSKHIAMLENIRDEQAAMIEEFRGREAKVELLLEKVAIQNEMIDKLEQSLRGPDYSEVKESAIPFPDPFRTAAKSNVGSSVTTASREIHKWAHLLRRESWNVWWAMMIILLLPYTIVVCISILQCFMGPGPCKLRHSWLQNLPFLDYCVYTIQAQFS